MPYNAKEDLRNGVVGNSVAAARGKLQIKASSKPPTIVHAKMIWKVDKRGEEDGQICSPIDVGFLPKQMLVVSELENERLQLFDSKGEPVYVIAEGDIRPRGVVTEKEEGNIAAVCDKDKTVKMYTADGGKIGSWSKELFSKPNGLAITSDDKFIVTDLEPDEPKINIFEADGLEILRFGNLKEGPEYIKSPNYVAVDSHKRILISDWANHCVKVFDLNGKLIARFGDRGKDNGQLTYPNGIAVDYHDNVLVADNGNHRVSMFSSSGKFIQNIIHEKESLIWPEGIAVSNSGLLAITEFGIENDAIKCYQL